LRIATLLPALAESVRAELEKRDAVVKEPGTSVA
jgi:hypothetical protein